MKNQRTKQAILSLLIVLSLFASSVAACSCSHHQEKAEADTPSCHQHSMENHSDAMPMSAENFSAFDADDNCVCMQSAPRVFAKSEVVKIKKQTAAILPNIVVSIKLTEPIVVVENFDFAKPFYLSDSFYNLKSPRAPPIA